MGHAMTYDAERRRVVLFGGINNFSSPHAVLRDTWEWDGRVWQIAAPATSPPPRQLAAMAYDAGRKRVVLFGGKDADGVPLDDTWEWDGVTWSNPVTVPAPPRRFGAGMAYDPIRGETVLQGGADLTDIFDTWTWNGTAWTAKSPTTVANTNDPAMTFDATRGRIVLMTSGPTWEWDGSTWHLAPRPPTPHFFNTLAFDIAHGQSVSFGGLAFDQPITPLGDTLSYTGTWTTQPLATLPTTGGSLVYDGATGTTIHPRDRTRARLGRCRLGADDSDTHAPGVVPAAAERGSAGSVGLRDRLRRCARDERAVRWVRRHQRGAGRHHVRGRRDRLDRGFASGATAATRGDRLGVRRGAPAGRPVRRPVLRRQARRHLGVGRH
jgi:hypothetical protein